MGSNPIINTPLLLTQMETTETQTISLVERFKNAEEKVSTYYNGEEYRWYPKRRSMERELGVLLGYEAEGSFMLNYNNSAELLKEYKENFEWDSAYSVEVRWEIEPASYTNSVDCSSPEEIKEYLTNEKQLETPSWNDEVSSCISYGSDFTGERELKAAVGVSNLRLKAKHKYLVSVLIGSAELTSSIEDSSSVVEQLKTLFPTWEVLSITPND